MRKLSKILVLVLTLSLILGMLAVFASAEDAYVAKIGDQEYATLEAAWAAALESADAEVEIDLIADVTLSAALTNAENKKIVLDLNDYTLKTAVGEATSTDAPVNAQPNGAFYLKAEGAALAIKNGSLDVQSGLIVTGETASGTPDSYLTTVELDNLYITRSTPIASDLFLALTKTVFNFNRVDVYIPTAGRLMKPFGAVQNNFTDCNFIVYSHMIHNYTPLATVKAEKDFMDWSFTNCRFVTTTEKTDNATIMFRNEARSINATDTELYTYDPETKEVTSLLPDTNFYNCEIFATPNGKQLIYNFGARNWHFYGGHYGIHASNFFAHATTSTALSQQISVVELHKYEGEYPTFDLKKPDTNVIAKGLYDAKVTVTLDDSNAPTGFSAISQNKTGAFYQTEDGYVFIPDGDEALESIKEGVIAVNWRGMLRNKTFSLTTDGGGTDNKTAGFYFYMPKPSSGSGTIINTTKADVNGDIYGLYQWTAVSSITTKAMNDNWFLNGTSNLDKGTATHNKVSDVDYVTFEIDMKRPDDGTLTQLSGDGLALHLYDTDKVSSVTKNILTNAQYKALLDDGKWHNLTVVIDSKDDTANTAYVYTDGEFLKTVALTMPEDATKAAFSHLAWNWATGSKTVGEGLCRDNWKVTFYGFNTTTAYEGFTGLATATKLTDLAEYADFQVKPTYVASVGDNYYTSYADAHAAAEAGDRIELYANVGMVFVEKAVTVLTNGYEFSPVSGTMMYDRTGTDGRAYNFSTAPAKYIANAYYYNSDDDLEFDAGEWEFINYDHSVPGIVYSEELISILENNGPGVGEYAYNKVTGNITQLSWEYRDDCSWIDPEGEGGDPEVTLCFVSVYKEIDDASEIGYIVLDANENLISYGGTSILDLTAAVEGAQADTTIKLLCDFKFTDPDWQVISPVKNLTLDLNGKKLSFVGNESGDQPKAFRFNSPGEITIKNGTVVLASIDGDAGQKGDSLVWVTNAGVGSTVTLEDVNFYGCRAVQVNGNTGEADPATTINVIGGQYVRVAADGQGLFGLIAENVKLNVTGADIVSSGYVVSFGEPGSEATEALKTSATFTNCSILVGENGGNIVNTKNTSGDDQKNAFCTLTIEDCYVHGVANSVGGSKVVVLGESNFFTKAPEYTSLGEGVELSLIDELVLHTDEIPDITVAANHNHVFGTQTIDCSFIYTTSKNLVTVTWTDGEKVLATEKVLAGDAATYTDSKVDGIYKTTYTGKSAELTENATVAATATLAVEATGLLHNLSLANEMSINLAIPAAAWAELKSVTVGGVPLEGTLMSIGGADYYLVSFDGVDAVSTTDAVDFVLAGNNENAAAQTVSLSVASYAEQLLKDGADDVEKELARAILAYTLAAHNLLAAEDVEAIAELTALLEGTTAPEAKTEFAGAVNTMVNVTVLTGGSLRLDATPAFVIYLAEGVTEDTVVTVSYESANDGLVEKTVTLNATNNSAVLMGMKVYDLDNTLTVKVGGQVGTYNLAAYLNGLCSLADDGTAEDALNEAFANALYNYVVAAEEYRGIFDEPVVEE